MARLAARHTDLYKPRTRRERGYISSIASIYKDDTIEEPTILAARAMQAEESTPKPPVTIDGVKVFTQDGEFDLSDDELCL